MLTVIPTGILRLRDSGDRVRQLQTALMRLGWQISTDGQFGPTTAQAVESFQYSYAWTSGLVKNLTVDGIYGPSTQIALTHAIETGGRCSEHFWFTEFASRPSSAGDRHWIHINRRAVRWCEVARMYRNDRDGKGGTWGFSPVSAFRTRAKNAAVGGASRSRHMTGDAVDPGSHALNITADELIALGFTGGIGAQDTASGVERRGLVGHFDVRPGNSGWRYPIFGGSSFGRWGWTSRPMPAWVAAMVDTSDMIEGNSSSI